MAIDSNKVHKYIRDELGKRDKPIDRGQTGMRVRRVQESLRCHECRTNIDDVLPPCHRELQGREQRRLYHPPTW